MRPLSIIRHSREFSKQNSEKNSDGKGAEIAFIREKKSNFVLFGPNTNKTTMNNYKGQKKENAYSGFQRGPPP